MTFDATARPRPAISPMTETMTTAIIIRCILSRPFSTEYAVDNARESEEGDRGERCGNERYGQTLKEFRHVAALEALSDAREHDHGEHEAETAAERAHHRLAEIVVVLNVYKHDAEHRAVRCYQRKIDTKRIIKRGHILLEDYLDELNKSRYDENEYYSLEIFKIIGHEQLRVDGICNSSREQHDEYNGGTHSDCGVELLRHAEERADAEELCENEVLCKDTAEK